MPTLDSFFKPVPGKAPLAARDSDTMKTPGNDSLKSPKKLTQLCFDSKSAIITCRQCQMTYNSTLKSDIQLHSKFHENFLHHLSD